MAMMKFYISEHNEGIAVTSNDQILSIESNTLEALAFAQGIAVGACKDPDEDLPVNISLAIFKPEINPITFPFAIATAYNRGLEKGKELAKSIIWTTTNP